MENKEVILATVLVIMLSSLAFNLDGLTGFTGNFAVDSSASLRLDPIIVKAGSDLTLTVVPGKQGTSRFIAFYQSHQKLGETTKLCNDLRCNEKVTLVYPIPSYWSGDFIAEIYDYTSESYIKKEFRVE